MTFGDFSVTVDTEELRDFYLFSTLLLQYIPVGARHRDRRRLRRTRSLMRPVCAGRPAQTGEKRTIGHFWFIAWPDHGVPSTPESVIKFLRDVRSYQTEWTGPEVIHCSAGIGRTGTFSAVDIGMQQYNLIGKVDILGIVARLREDRGGMVQTEEQYEFIYHALLAYARSKQQQQVAAD